MLIIVMLICIAYAAISTFGVINTGGATPRLDLLGPILNEGAPEDAYVATRVLPTLVVQKRFGAIPSFLFTDAQGTLAIKHAPKTGFAQVQSQLGQKTYNTTEAGVEEPLSFEDYEIMGRDMAQMAVSRRLLHIVLRARDVALSQAFFSAAGETLFATNLITAANPWSGGDASLGTPLDDVMQMKRAIALQTGTPGGCMLIGYDCYLNLCKNHQIRTAVRANFGFGTSNGADAVQIEIPAKTLAALFNLEEVIVAPGVTNTAQEGLNANLSFIWPSNYALIFRRAKNANDVREIALGRTFVYDLAATFNELTTQQTLDMLRGLMFESYPDAKINCDWYRAREYVDMVVLASQTASLIKSI